LGRWPSPARTGEGLDGLEWFSDRVAIMDDGRAPGESSGRIEEQESVHLQGNCHSKPFQELAVTTLSGHMGHNASTASISSTQSDRSSFAGGATDTT
jgi:hypothetical protein